MQFNISEWLKIIESLSPLPSALLLILIIQWYRFKADIVVFKSEMKEMRADNSKRDAELREFIHSNYVRKDSCLRCKNYTEKSIDELKKEIKERRNHA